MELWKKIDTIRTELHKFDRTIPNCMNCGEPIKQVEEGDVEFQCTGCGQETLYDGTLL